MSKVMLGGTERTYSTEGREGGGRASRHHKVMSGSSQTLLQGQNDTVCFLQLPWIILHTHPHVCIPPLGGPAAAGHTAP